MSAVLLAATVAALCAFTFLNGFRDVANATAAAVRTRALAPRAAVLASAGFALAGTVLGIGLGDALLSVGALRLPSGTAGLAMLLCAALVALGWCLLCYRRGIPTSSTHSLLAGLAGAGAAAHLLGLEGIGNPWLLMLTAILLPLLVTPLLSAGLAYALVIPLTWRMRHTASSSANRSSRTAQAIASCGVALGLGLQDGQRNAATIALAVAVARSAPMDSVPLWASLAAGALLAGGALFGGWRIAHTIGYRLVRIDPLRGSVANGVCAALIYVGSLILHLPLSTTQAATGAIVGAGANQRFETVASATVLGVAGYWVATPAVCFAGGAVFMLACGAFL